MRTFIALELPPLFVDETAALARTLERHVDGRFMKRETYHLTLAFLGDASSRDIDAAMNVLDAAAESCSSAPLHPARLGTFGRGRDAVLWLGLQENDELKNLAAFVRRELDAYGVAYDRKAFKPHITLARRAAVAGELPSLPFPNDDVATTITLFKSQLRSEGAQYTPLYSVELGPGKIRPEW